MIPYRDDNPTLSTPVITIALIGANVLVWLIVQGMGQQPQLAESVCTLGLIPGELLQRVPAGYSIPMGGGLSCQLEGVSHWSHIFTSMFLHGGWLHLLGNMWFLWLFGNNIEDSMGSGRFLVFYLLCGMVAALSQVFTSPASPIPMVGASGAISGVMGAYVVLYPRVRIHMLIFLGIFITRIIVPAWVMLGYWFLLQLVSGLPGLQEATGGVAFFAHVGGFVSGAVLIGVFRSPQRVAQHRALARTM